MRRRWHRPVNVFDSRRKLRRSPRGRWGARRGGGLAGGGLAGGALLGAGMILCGVSTSAAAAGTMSARFAVCGMVRQTCVVDGDTFWLKGEKIRIADVDTPEISSPGCPAEYDRGIAARDRLVVLLNDGPFALQPIGNRDKDQYGRKLRVVTRGGASLGDRLVGEGLARTWTGRREPWC
jgi:endonuclease YncB( thermonuclease family)